MAENGEEKPKVVARDDPQSEEKQPPQNQIAPRHGWTNRDIRRDISYVLGALAAILFGAVRPEVSHPYDYWAAAGGAGFLLIGLGLYLYDVIGRGKLLAGG